MFVITVKQLLNVIRQIISDCCGSADCRSADCRNTNYYICYLKFLNDFLPAVAVVVGKLRFELLLLLHDWPRVTVIRHVRRRFDTRVTVDNEILIADIHILIANINEVSNFATVRDLVGLDGYTCASCRYWSLLFPEKTIYEF
jgi:hypothetical protein